MLLLKVGAWTPWMVNDENNRIVMIILMIKLMIMIMHGPGKLSTLRQNAAASTPSTSSIIWSYHHSHIPNKKSVGKFGKNGLE